MRGVQGARGLSPLRGPSAGAISSVQPSSLRGERRSLGLFRTTVTESFLFGFSPTSHPRLANYKAFATVYFSLKLDKNDFKRSLQSRPGHCRFSRRGERRSAG